MKHSQERRNQILRLLQKEGTVGTQELSDMLMATPATIRRDLDYLEEIGALTRSWGKATLSPSFNYGPSSDERKLHSTDEKQRIAAMAASFVKDGDSIILDSATTVLAMAEYLKSRSTLSIVTNYIPAAYAFSDTQFPVQFSGGFFDTKMMSMVGPDCEEFFHSINVSKAFLGTSGFRPDQGFSVYSPFQSSAKRSIIQSADKVFLLMDSSKVNVSSINTFASIRDIDYLVTTSVFDRETEELFLEAGTEILYA